MKQYIILFLCFFQFGYSIEKDSLVQNPFFKFQQFANELYEDCDACGCAASGGSMGFASMLNSNFAGLRYFSQSYKSTNGLYSNSPWYDEDFNTIQFWARIPLIKKVQISAFVPYHFHNRATATGKQSISGIGDATLLGMYQLYQTTKDSVLVKHSLQIGYRVPTSFAISQPIKT